MIDLKDDPVFQQIVATQAQKTDHLVDFIRTRHPDIQAGAKTGGCWRAPTADRKHGLIDPDGFMTEHFPRHDLKEGSIVAFGHIHGDNGRCHIGRVIEVLDRAAHIDEVHEGFRGETSRFVFSYTHVVEVIETIDYDDNGNIRVILPEDV